MLRAIIIDDEQAAITSIECILNEFCPTVEIVGKAESADEGLSLISERNPDIVFLDIEMPHLNGFGLLEKIGKRNFDVVFITAHNNYAIKAFKYSAVDYILKPVEINEIVDAVTKIEGFKKKVIYSDYTTLFENLHSEIPKKLVVTTNKGRENINIDDIICVTADGSYSEFSLKNGRKIITSKNLKEYQELFNGREFFRPHKSFLVSISHIKRYNFNGVGYIEMSNDLRVPISRRKKADFIELMNRISSKENMN